MWVKICGNTNLADAQLAADLRADALGFIFAPSARRVTVEQAREIVAQLPDGIEKVGVFTDPNGILQTVEAVGLTAVQLHMAFDPSLVEKVKPSVAKVLQVLDWDTTVSPEEAGEKVRSAFEAIDRQGLVDLVLVDAKTRAGSGGTGVSFDWSEARTYLMGHKTPLVVAGGLRPETVAMAIATLQPFGVDVVSGVEREKGLKDSEKLREFLRNAKEAAQ